MLTPAEKLVQTMSFWDFALLAVSPLILSLLQKAGLRGAAGPHAARSAVAVFRCGAAAVSPRTTCARERWRKGGPATLSPALVSPPVHQLLRPVCRWLGFSANNCNCAHVICAGKERNRSQGLRAIVGLRRDNVEAPNQGAVATQAGETGGFMSVLCVLPRSRQPQSAHLTMHGFLSNPPPPPPDAKMDEWSSWSSCSVSCGEGWQSRSRLCATTSFTSQCTGPLRENRPCNNTAVCPGEWPVPRSVPPRCRAEG